MSKHHHNMKTKTSPNMKMAPNEALSLRVDANISVSMLNVQQDQHLFVETMLHTINIDFLFSFLSAENTRLN